MRFSDVMSWIGLLGIERDVRREEAGRSVARRNPEGASRPNFAAEYLDELRRAVERDDRLNIGLDLRRVIREVCLDRNVDPRSIVEALEQSMLSAAERTFGRNKHLEAKFNLDIGEVEVFAVRTVVETIDDPENHVTLEVARRELDPEAEIGDELLAKLSPEQFGRIASQATDAGIIQPPGSASSDSVFDDFKGRIGELAFGIVQRREKGRIVVNLGRADAILPESEQIPGERYREGGRIKAYIVDVWLSGRAPQIVLSRIHPGLLIKLFEYEVPEIYEGVVEVKGVAREPGGRAKIAVTSHDADIDPVAACVGPRGRRVEAVVQEIPNETIDIVPWVPDAAEYVCRALAPGKVAKIIMDEDYRAMEVIVPDDQLLLAIGDRGENIRLASQLTGWRLEVLSESEAEEEAQRVRASISAIPGIDGPAVEALVKHGFRSCAEVAAADSSALEEVDGLELSSIDGLLAAARSHVAQLHGLALEEE